MEIEYRFELKEDDAQAVDRIVRSTGFFSEAEVALAVELVSERLQRGEGSGYYFVFAELACEVIGYTCYGPIPATSSSFDMYWIAVSAKYHGQGVGRELVRQTEERVRLKRGTQIFIDTAGREQYRPTREFYQSCGYRKVAELEDFYSPGDAKIVFRKSLII